MLGHLEIQCPVCGEDTTSLNVDLTEDPDDCGVLCEQCGETYDPAETASRLAKQAVAWERLAYLVELAKGLRLDEPNIKMIRPEDKNGA